MLFFLFALWRTLVHHCRPNHCNILCSSRPLVVLQGCPIACLPKRRHPTSGATAGTSTTSITCTTSRQSVTRRAETCTKRGCLAPIRWHWRRVDYVTLRAGYNARSSLPPRHIWSAGWPWRQPSVCVTPRNRCSLHGSTRRWDRSVAYCCVK